MIKMRLVSFVGASPNALFGLTAVEKRMGGCKARKRARWTGVAVHPSGERR
jgi:hypothetical protein